MSDAQIGRRALLRGAGGLAALAALPSLSACGTGTSRSVGSGGKGGKTVVVRDSSPCDPRRADQGQADPPENNLNHRYCI